MPRPPARLSSKTNNARTWRFAKPRDAVLLDLVDSVVGGVPESITRVPMIADSVSTLQWNPVKERGTYIINPT